jgi:hemerythrin-like domain-containing protein
MSATPNREQVVLPGQAATAPGPVDLTGMFLMHHAFRRDLARFVAAVERTPADDRECYERLVRRWRLFTSALHHHHEGEDAGLWPILRGRVAQGDLLTLEAMAIEHDTLGPQLANCGAWLGRLAAGGYEGDRQALLSRLGSLRVLLEHHLDHEESECLPLLQRHLSQADWDFVEKEYFQKGLTPGEVVSLVPWALHGIPAPVRHQILTTLSPAARVAWRFTHVAFERSEQRIFGPDSDVGPTAPPSDVAS